MIKIDLLYLSKGVLSFFKGFRQKGDFDISINDDKTAIEIVHQLEEHYNIFNSCFLVPYACIDGEMRYAEKLKILCRNVRFRKYADISSLDDPDIAVTP